MTRQTGAMVGLAATVSFLMGRVAAGSGPAAPTTALPARPDGDVARPLMLGTVPRPIPATTGAGVDNAAVAARHNGAVDNVDAASRGTEERSRTSPQRWSRDLGDDPSAPREGSGSGFIVDPAGYVLTNFHVIEGADRITLTLSDGRAFRADVVGIDPAIDVALLRIPDAERLPVATLGDSDTLRVGEWVCAIGNPLGYVHSVTVGVVSFLGRKLFDPSLDAFIQTDAAISFGNSGGPLINARGEVVGMTTAISSQASNIGFAIPITQVVDVLPQLREHGRVSRGYIGVTLTSVTGPLRRALRLASDRGALVQDVTAATPGERAGLRPYDVIAGVDAQPVRTDEDLIRYVSSRMPGTIVELDVYRDGVARTVPIKLTERPGLDGGRPRGPRERSLRPVSSREYGPFGVTVRDLDQAMIQRNRIPDGVQGVMVSYVDPAGAGRLARLRTGQVIMEINRRRVTSAADFRAVTAALEPGAAVAALIYDPAVDGRLIVTVHLDGTR
jgi:serine protease Do